MSHKQQVVFKAIRCLKLRRIIVVDFLLSFALLVGGCQSFGMGKAKSSTKDEITMTPTEEKKAKLLKAIDRKFENPQAHFELGQLYQADGMWSQAEHEYNVALSFDPVHRKAQAARVKVLLAIGDTVKSELLADEYMGQASVSPAESLKLGLAFQAQKLDDYALACYQQALHLAPTSAKINRQIGYYYLSRGDRELAKSYLSRSFQLDPLQSEVAGELGRLGVAVAIPRKTQKDTTKLDKIVEQSDKEVKP
jgi:tetratricopeptide (TPR) repeat protein